LDVKLTAVILFALTYALLLAFPKKRAHIAVGSALAFIALGILPIGKVFYAVDWNVILMIAGTMGIVSLFIETRMPALIGDIIIDKTPSVKWAIVALSMLAGIISAFVDNVATVLIIAPVALTISKKLNISPVHGIIAIALASNLQGAATLVGDTTSILLGGQAKLDFLDFFVFQGRMGLFFIVQISAVLASLVLLIVFRKYKQPVTLNERETVSDYFPSFLLLGVIALLIGASFIPPEYKPEVTNGLICMGLFIIGLVRKIIKTKSLRTARAALKEIDFFTLFLLAGLFIVVGGVTEAGIVDDISKFFVSAGNGNIFLIYTLIVWSSVLLSAVIDNIPYVATMLPVVAGIAAQLGVAPYLLYFGLLSGATLGGNLTPIGASANIAALGILRKDGYEVKAGTFMKVSVPFTLTAVVAGYVLVWLVWR
jgi:Na+/H+ antiporter NhaD/arsenite permease-like protein